MRGEEGVDRADDHLGSVLLDEMAGACDHLEVRVLDQVREPVAVLDRQPTVLLTPEDQGRAAISP